MTLEEQLTKYGRSLESLDELIAGHPQNNLVVETELLNQACKTVDVTTMLQLFACAQYVTEKGVTIGELRAGLHATELH